MAITKTWEVNTCERDLSDGYITKVIYRVKAMEDGVEIDGTRQTGSVTFTKPSSLPSDFITYDTSAKTPNAETIIGWVKTKLNADAAEENGPSVADIEATMDNAITLIKTPVTASGVPWS
tara:strand:- start:30 stop:389 length:360 start_codon:yes stop_codon:yes gene_type:complete